VLRQGQWYKLAVTQDGIYKINHAFLEDMGINVGTIDPRSIKIFGNGGKLLPQPNSLERPVDLIENAIIVVGEGSGQYLYPENDLHCWFLPILLPHPP